MYSAQARAHVATHSTLAHVRIISECYIVYIVSDEHIEPVLDWFAVSKEQMLRPLSARFRR
jgi:hypothetical protein